MAVTKNKLFTTQSIIIKAKAIKTQNLSLANDWTTLSLFSMLLLSFSSAASVSDFCVMNILAVLPSSAFSDVTVVA